MFYFMSSTSNTYICKYVYIYIYVFYDVLSGIDYILHSVLRL